MAPPPEYDKEPKAPDKSATNISCEETKTVHNLVNEQPSNSDNKSASTASNADVENNKLVETLDDGQLRALLDEAITYKCPKDREGKSSLFKDLLEEVEQAEQASEAAARGAGAGARCARAPPRPSRNRRALPHSNSLQDLVAALSAEPPRRHRPAPAPAPAPVSARAIHGGSLPSGVDTSFLLGEEPMGGGYLATVRCVNPPPLNERRVSATDANAAAEVEMLTRRSKPASFPMTYTARATLEIGAVAARSPAAPAHPPAPAHQVPYPPPRRTTRRVTTSDPHWDFMHALTAPKKIVTEPDSMQKPNSKNDQSRKINTGSTKGKLDKNSETRDIRPGDENQDLPKPIKSKKRNTPGLLNVPISWVVKHESAFPKPQGPKPNTQQSMEHRKSQQKNKNPKPSFSKTRTSDQVIKSLSTQKYSNEGYDSLPREIPQRYDYANYVGQKQELLYSYRLSPSVGPPERIYTKAYNPRSRRSTTKKFRGFIPSEPENAIPNFSAISERLDENVTSENDNVPANVIQEHLLNDNSNLSGTLEDDITDLNISLPEDDISSNQFKLLNALFPKKTSGRENGGGRRDEQEDNKFTCGRINKTKKDNQDEISKVESIKEIDELKIETKSDGKDEQEVKIKDKDKENISHQKHEQFDWTSNVNNWYDTLSKYAPVPVLRGEQDFGIKRNFYQGSTKHSKVFSVKNPQSEIATAQAPKDIIYSSDNAQNYAPKDDQYKWTEYTTSQNEEAGAESTMEFSPNSYDFMERDNPQKLNRDEDKSDYSKEVFWMIDTVDDYMYKDYDKYDYSYIEPVNDNIYRERQKYRERVGKSISRPVIDIDINPRNIRPMTIGKPLPESDTDDSVVNECINENTPQHDLTSKSEENALSTNQIKSDIFDSSSDNSNKAIENLEDKVVIGSDIITNICVRASTPIADPNPIIEAENDTKNTEELQVQTGPKESQVVNIEDNKGTVHIPVVNQTDYVNVDNDEGLPTDFYSFSKDKDERRRETVEMVEIKAKEENSICRNLIESFTNKFSLENINEIELTHVSTSRDCEELMQNEHELVEYPFLSHEDNNSFSKFVADQRRLFQALEVNDLVDSAHEHSLVSNSNDSEKVQCAKDELSECVSEIIITQDNYIEESQCVKNEPTNSEGECLSVEHIKYSKEVVIRLDKFAIEKASGGKCGGEELTNNAYVFLTLPQNLLVHLSNIDDTILLHNEPTSTNNNSKKKKHPAVHSSKRKEMMLQKYALRALLFEKYIKSDSADKSKSKGMSSVTIKEVDSTIPFSCITTPEVVASCNTTSSTVQASVAVDPKPLQLACGYRAVASLTGGASPPAPPAPPAHPAALRPHPLACLCCRPAPEPATAFSPRSVVSSSFNGLPLSRPNYGSTASTTQDEFKKSLDENGNSVQGYSSPLSGSSQHKKPRRKKSSKNETVIKSHQIDGYQGNKDLNEVLRFIESNAESTRAGKLGRTKHKDDSDDKGGKKRSTERRKDKESKMKRATSMEELSRTKLEDLTDKPGKKERRTDTAPKAERRSWGDDARESFYYEPEPTDADFQTVTKKRKPRRRADEPPEPPPRPASPRARRVSAPPSDRSNDSNDDMDSVHSLPADAPKAASAHAPVSYADIARTRHNIPDLIESCNFYAEGEVRSERADGLQPPPPDAEGYPALEPRGGRRPPHTPGKRAPPPPRHGRKTERAESVTLSSPETLGGSACVTSHGAADDAEAEETAGTGAGAGAGLVECPAPDVVADRRPPVILLDSARAQDMDGVTFGFDLNPMLLRGPTRRPRCDLVRDAIEGATVPAHTNGTVCPEPGSPSEPGAGPDTDPLLGVGVVVGCAALRYVAPRPPADPTHLHQIIDYVGAAWDDVVRCGSGKVRYFSE